MGGVKSLVHTTFGHKVKMINVIFSFVFLHFLGLINSLLSQNRMYYTIHLFGPRSAHVNEFRTIKATCEGTYNFKFTIGQKAV